MKWLLIVVGVILIIAAPLFFHFRPFFFKKNAGLEINCQPESAIFLEGRHLGQTPFKQENLQPGEYLLKITPSEAGLISWEKKVSLVAGVSTVISCQLAASQERSSSTILNLEPLNNKRLMVLAIISQPDGVLVKVDSVTRGFTPISLEDIQEGDHLVSLTLPGYQQKEIKAKTILGRKLIINVQLAKTAAGEEMLSPEATASAASQEAEPKTVVIKETPTGWLRVRWEPNLSASEAAKVKPGAEFILLEEKNDWYKIEFEEGREGWIASQYAAEN